MPFPIFLASSLIVKNIPPLTEGHSIQGTFHVVSYPIPKGRIWAIARVQLQGQDSSQNFAAVGLTDQVLTGVWLLPPGVDSNFIPDGWFSSTKGYPTLASAIKITDNVQEDGFNGAAGGGGFFSSNAFDNGIFVPQDWKILGVWAVNSGGSYPTTKANLLLSLYMADTDACSLQGQLSE